MSGWLVRRFAFAAALAACCATAASARAGKADVLDVAATCRPAPGGRAASICSFDVQVRHADAGWDHYANRWDVVVADGRVIASRVLRHPHVDEQPFTRSLGRVRIPHETKTVVVRANDSVHGAGGVEVTFVVPHAARSGGAGGTGAEAREPEGVAPAPGTE